MSWNTAMARSCLESSKLFAIRSKNKRKIKIHLETEFPFQVITNVHLDNGEIIVIDSCQWVIEGSEGLGMFALPSDKTPRCYQVRPVPLFKSGEIIKSKSRKHTAEYKIIEIAFDVYVLERDKQQFNLSIGLQNRFKRVKDA